MRRGYTVERYQILIEKIRRAMPGVALTTDIIVGHPGETREHFAQTLALVEATRFDKVHIAAFSARPGTRAAEQEQHPALAVPEEEKQARRRELEQAQERIATEINAHLLNQTVEVLVEGENRGKWRGRTGTNKLVFFEHPDNWTGKLVHVKITHTGPWSLQGHMQHTQESNHALLPHENYEKHV
jgi:tRNA-2-methylthio-N6-dimethylallyladenosine synthase